MHDLVKESSKASLCLCAENSCMYSYMVVIFFVMQMIFPVNVVNTKVVYNFLIFLALTFHDFRPDGLGVINFRSLLLGFACPLDRSK